MAKKKKKTTIEDSICCENGCVKCDPTKLKEPDYQKESMENSEEKETEGNLKENQYTEEKEVCKSKSEEKRKAIVKKDNGKVRMMSLKNQLLWDGKFVEQEEMFNAEPEYAERLLSLTNSYKRVTQ